MPSSVAARPCACAACPAVKTPQESAYEPILKNSVSYCLGETSCLWRY